MEARPETIERITQEELRQRLQSGEDVVLIDARDTHGYEASNVKPAGAVRIAPGAEDGEVARLPRDRLIVTV